MDLGISGLVSGFDWRSFVDQMVEIERAPQQRMRSEQSLLQQRNTSYSNIKTQLEKLKALSDSLKDPLFFDSRIAKSGDSTIDRNRYSGHGTRIIHPAFSQLATAAFNKALKLGGSERDE
jgi:flagellar hook-associated protein 2